MTKTTALFLAASLTAVGSFALADSHEMEGMDMEGMDMSGTEGMDMSGMMDMSEMVTGEDLQALMEPMDTMMGAMPMESSGDIDSDFLLMMIPHHQSAIDMARVELERGDDEETRAMAQQVIDSQEAEIAEMRTMLERMGVEAPAAPAE